MSARMAAELALLSRWRDIGQVLIVIQAANKAKVANLTITLIVQKCKNSLERAMRLLANWLIGKSI